MTIPLFDMIAPHYCYACGEIGAPLCEYCKYNIVSEPFESCIVCKRLASPSRSICGQCKVPYTKAWCVASRESGLKKLVDAYKFERVRAAHHPLAGLLDEVLPVLPAEVIVTSVPTIAPHIRRRGYDHAALIARTFAKQRQLPYSPSLRRKTQSVQHRATRKERFWQAKEAFRSAPCRAVPYILIDDICTTGATLEYAAQALLDAGASEVWVAVIVAQPLEKVSGI